MLTRDLKKSNDNLVVHGKLIISLTTNLSRIRTQGHSSTARPNVGLSQPPLASTTTTPLGMHTDMLGSTTSMNTPAASGLAPVRASSSAGLPASTTPATPNGGPQTNGARTF